MSKLKIQRVDFSASDWLGGTIGLTIAERGVYVTACALIYTHCGPITRTDLRRACPGEGHAFSRALKRLVALGKLTVDDGQIDQKRCEIELERAKKRIENGRQGGRPANEIKQIEKPPFSPTRAQKGEAKREDLRKSSKGDRGRFAPSVEPAPTPDPEPAGIDPDPPTRAEVDELFERTVAALRGDVPKGIRDPTAYKAAVKDARFTNLVKAVNEWVGTGLDGEARWAAWEVLDAAEKAETRAAMTPVARKALDKIVEMYRASSAGMETAA